MSRSWPALLRNYILILLLWEVCGQYEWIASGALPAISDIAVQLWHDRADYPLHIQATLRASTLGFIIGNVIAVFAGILFVLSPVALRLARGLNIAIFALPPIAIAPILALTLTGDAPRVVLAAMGCYFITMTATVIGLTQHDGRIADLVRAYGGGRWQVLRWVQLRGALPAILRGLQIAAPNAVLGAILAEFGGGGRWGLGVYLLGSLGRGDPARLWGIGLAATAIAGCSYLLFAAIARLFAPGSLAVTLSTASPPNDPLIHFGLIQRLMLLAGSILLPLIVWWAFIEFLEVPSMIGKTPADVITYLFFSDTSGDAQRRLLAALAQTMPITLIGMFAGLTAAFLLALASQLYPRIVQSFMPIALITQTMPLVALTPLLVLMLGRGYSVILWITVSVTFFPAFVTIAQGLTQVPKSGIDVARAYGGSPWKTIRLIAIPFALPYLFAATRLTAPRALLGVMIAEWLATGTGLGNLLNQSRGYLDFGMIWSVAFVSVLVSVLFYQIVVFTERRWLKRMGLQSSE